MDIMILSESLKESKLEQLMAWMIDSVTTMVLQMVRLMMTGRH